MLNESRRRRPATRKQGQHGFTLTELMVTISVLGIITAFALPAFRMWIVNAQIKTAAESILSGLQLARGEAVRRNTRTYMTISTDTDANTWRMGCVTADAATCPSTIQQSTHDGSSKIILNFTPNGASTVSFNPFGQVVANADGSQPLSSVTVDVPSDVLAPADTRELTINISRGGQVRLCDPSAPPGDPRAC